MYYTFNKKRLNAGAIYFECKVNCSVSLTDNEFLQNGASDGGAVRWVNTNFTTNTENNGTIIADSNFYRDNFAVYGNDSGSFPNSIHYYMGRGNEDNRTHIDADKGEIRIAPGQEFELIMEILDMDGKIYTNEQKAIATIDFSSRKNLEDSEKSVVIGRDSIAKNGVFTFG